MQVGQSHNYDIRPLDTLSVRSPERFLAEKSCFRLFTTYPSQHEGSTIQLGVGDSAVQQNASRSVANLSVIIPNVKTRMSQRDLPTRPRNRGVKPLLQLGDLCGRGNAAVVAPVWIIQGN